MANSLLSSCRNLSLSSVESSSRSSYCCLPLSSDTPPPPPPPSAAELMTAAPPQLASAVDYSCKASVTESAYQKRLKLQEMKFHYCAEELGSESGAAEDDYPPPLTVRSATSAEEPSHSFERSFAAEDDDESPAAFCRTYSEKSVDSFIAPSHCRRNPPHSSFPPPLSHCLPLPESYEDDGAVCTSVRAFRQDGRLILKQIAVPCRRYLYAHRSGGRLTLRLLTRSPSSDEEDDHPPTNHSTASAGYGFQDRADQQPPSLQHRCSGGAAFSVGFDAIEDPSRDSVVGSSQAAAGSTAMASSTESPEAMSEYLVDGDDSFLPASSTMYIRQPMLLPESADDPTASALMRFIYQLAIAGGAAAEEDHQHIESSRHSHYHITATDHRIGQYGRRRRLPNSNSQAVRRRLTPAARCAMNLRRQSIKKGGGKDAGYVIASGGGEKGCEIWVGLQLMRVAGAAAEEEEEVAELERWEEVARRTAMVVAAEMRSAAPFNVMRHLYHQCGMA